MYLADRGPFRGPMGFVSTSMHDFANSSFVKTHVDRGDQCFMLCLFKLCCGTLSGSLFLICAVVKPINFLMQQFKYSAILLVLWDELCSSH